MKMSQTAAAGLLVALGGIFTFTTIAGAQGAVVDSALMFERMAIAEESALSDSAPARAIRFSRQSLAIYLQRGDERGQARSHVRIAVAHAYQQRADSSLAHARRAVTLLRPLQTDSLALAVALAVVANELLISGGDVDSSSTYWAESMQLFRDQSDPVQLSAAFDRHAYVLFARSGRDSTFRKHPANLDSALYYFHASIATARPTRDSVFAARSLGNIANIWHLRGREDSVLAYRRLAISISTQVSDSLQMFYDMAAIGNAFAGPTHGRRRKSTFNADSSLVWYRKAYEHAVRIAQPEQLQMAVSVARSFNIMGEQDSSRLYLARALETARTARNIAAERYVVRMLAEWFTQLGFADSTIAVHRDFERSFRARDLPPTTATKLAMLDAWHALGHAHEARQNVDSALFWFRQALDSASSDSLLASRHADALLALGNLFLLSQRPDSAGLYFRQLESLATRPALRRWQLTAQYGLGRLYVHRGDVDAGMAALAEVARSSTGVARADALSRLASVEQSIGRLDSALAHRRMAVSLYSAAGQNLAEAGAMLGLGGVYQELGLMDSALVIYRSALEMSVEDGQREGISGALRNMAMAFSNADHADSSFVYLRRAQRIANDMDSPFHRANMLNSIGMMYHHVGQGDSARRYVEESHALFSEMESEEWLSTTLSNLAYIRLQSVADDSTFSLLRRALAMQLQAQARSGEAITRLLLARAFTNSGQADSSLVYAREAVQLSRRVRNRQSEGRALTEVARAFAVSGRADSARVFHTEAVAVMRAAGFARGVRAALADMAELLRTTPGAIDLPRAIAYYDSAAAVVDLARRGAGGEENELAFSEAQVDVFGGWARAWIGRSGEVGSQRSAAASLAAVERGRAQSLMDLLTRMQSANRATALAQYRPTVGADLAAESDSVLSSLRAQREAALTYLIAGDTLFTWLLSPDGKLELQTPAAITERELNFMVRSARRAFDADDSRSVPLDPDELTTSSDSTELARRDPVDDWRRLAELLLPSDLSSKVPAGTPIVVVPHGSIGLVPFSALAAGSDSDARRNRTDSTIASGATTLGVRNPLRYAPSFAALRASERRTRAVVARSTPASAGSRRIWSATRPAGVAPAAAPVSRNAAASSVVAQALVVGNPTMPYVYSGRGTNRARLQPLPGAEAESRTIAQLLGTQSITGRAATETSVRLRMQSAPLIHFATHGLAYGTSSSARRSYLAFAADSTNDGLLTLGELMDDQALTLKAELVVLSACQTGLGNMKKAEGSIGLQRAFLAKGARSVLVSLWNVDDKATRLLMEKFYAYWLDPTTVRSKATALQMAQNAVRGTPGYAHPKYWAAFQLVGAE